PQRRSEGLAAVDSGHRIVGQFGIVLVGLHIVKNAVAAAHRGFIVRAGRVRKTDARREVLPVGRHIAGATGAGVTPGATNRPVWKSKLARRLCSSTIGVYMSYRTPRLSVSLEETR